MLGWFCRQHSLLGLHGHGAYLEPLAGKGRGTGGACARCPPRSATRKKCAVRGGSVQKALVRSCFLQPRSSPHTPAAGTGRELPWARRRSPHTRAAGSPAPVPAWPGPNTQAASAMRAHSTAAGMDHSQRSTTPTRVCLEAAAEALRCCCTACVYSWEMELAADTKLV